jgi:type II secretory pathway component PulK
MKIAILAVLLLLALATIASGAATESGKSRYRNAKCLAVFIKTLQIFKIASLLN